MEPEVVIIENGEHTTNEPTNDDTGISTSN